MRIFVVNYQEMINSFNERLKDTEQIPHDSILLTNINGLFQNFLPTIKNSENILDKIIVDIISPLEQKEFIPLGINKLHMGTLPLIKKD